MTVYRRPGSDIFSYDFVLDGERHSGSTGIADEAAAKDFERAKMAEAGGLSVSARSILRRARSRDPNGRISRKGHVYMMRSGYFIKIGFSLDPADRFRSIQTASPFDCELLFSLPGSMEMERLLHREFGDCHYQREWFFLCGKLKRFVEELAKPDVPRELPPADPPMQSSI